MSVLPHDIIIDILSRLPAKSIGKFKTVSKYWFSLISSTGFVKLHHHQAISDTNTNHSRVFTMSCQSMYSVNYESSSCYEGIDDDSNAIMSLINPLKKESRVEYQSGSCYGLIYFVCTDDGILLWNPATQRTRIILDPPRPFSDGTRFYGLGYDFSIDDYKMVRVCSSCSGKSISSEVFNLKTDSWRTGQVSHIDINNPEEIMIFSNGSVYWLVNECQTILSFGMKDKVFIEIRLPDWGENRFLSLGDLKGCLYAAYGGDVGEDLDVWVMKEYGVEKSWNKVIKLNWGKILYNYAMTIVCFTHGNEVVIDLDSWSLIIFNLSDETIKKVKKCDKYWRGNYCNDWLVYETLFSPYGN